MENNFNICYACLISLDASERIIGGAGKTNRAPCEHHRNIKFPSRIVVVLKGPARVRPIPEPQREPLAD